jgi:hypothetical protein
MTRYLKALGLSVIAVCAMSAVAASGAQAVTAPHFTSATTPGEVHEHTILSGTSETEANGGVQKFKAGATVECYHAHFAGTSLTGTDESLTIEAEYTGNKTETLGTCETSGLVTHVNMEGCDFRLHAGVELAAAEFTGTVDVVCPEGKEIDIKITKAGGVETKCTLKIPGEGTAKGGTQNTGLKHVIYKNINTGGEPKRTDVTVEANVKEIEYTSEGTKVNCGVEPGVHNGAGGATYTGNSIISGENTEGKPLDVTVMQVSTP